MRKKATALNCEFIAKKDGQTHSRILLMQGDKGAQQYLFFAFALGNAAKLPSV